MRKGFFFILTLGILVAPAVLFAADLVPCGGANNPCKACHLVSLAQNVLQWLIKIMAFVIALTFAFGGFKMVMSAGNEGAVSSAKEMMTNSVIGFLLLLSGWLIVETVLANLVNKNIFKDGLWNQIQCVDAPPQTSEPIRRLPVGSEVNTNTRIMEAASKYQGASTMLGPQFGRLACAWAVNNVLQAAGISKIDSNSVVSMEAALQGGRGERIGQSSAIPGDIIIEAGSGHVGICINMGCTRVISNSSSNASFSWISGPDFKPSYTGGEGRIYRVKPGS